MIARMVTVASVLCSGCAFDPGLLDVSTRCPSGMQLLTASSDDYAGWDCEGMDSEFERAVPVMDLVVPGWPNRPTKYITVALMPPSTQLVIGADHEPVAGYANCDSGVVHIDSQGMDGWRNSALVHEITHLAQHCWGRSPEPVPGIDVMDDDGHANWHSTGILRAVEGLASGVSWAKHFPGPDSVLRKLEEME